VCTLDLGTDLKHQYTGVSPENVSNTEGGTKSHVKLSHVENRPSFTRLEEFILELDDSLSGDESNIDSDEMMKGACSDVGSSQFYPKGNVQSSSEYKMQYNKKQTAISFTPIYCKGGKAI